jgi:membrane associated rhomboid family serine protease
MNSIGGLMKFNTKAFAIASGLIYGFVLFISVLWLMARGYSNQETLLSMVYPFLAISPLGSLLGLIYGLFDGVIIGALFAWLYNHLAKAFDS